LEKAIPRVRVQGEGDCLDSRLCQRAVADLEFARTQPIRIARGLLNYRATSMAGRNNAAEFVATLDALCDLDANDALSLVKLAEAHAECLGLLESHRSPWLTSRQRDELQRRCNARGIVALRRAVALGYDNVRRLEGDIQETGLLVNFRGDPEYSRLI